MVFSVRAVAEDATDKSMESIIPYASIWGISAEKLKKLYKAEYEQCQIGEDEALRVCNVKLCSYNMDVYYIFGEIKKSSKGTGHLGLSKIAYILNDPEIDNDSGLDQCFQTLIEEVKRLEGEPDSIKKTTNIWINDNYRIELGKGKAEKYTGTNKTTVGIFIKQGNLSKQTSTPKPTNTPTPTPMPTNTPAPTNTPKPAKTPKPTKTPAPNYGKLDYKGVSRHPDKYAGKYVHFYGIVVQVQETSFIKYEGGSLFDEYYVLRVASKYEKYKYIDGYSTEDIVYVVVPKSKVEGGRLLEDDLVSVYGRYDGIETYTTIFGASVSIPRIEANRIVIK